MTAIIPTLTGLALVLALAIPPLSFMLFVFHRWRRAPNAVQGVLFRAMTFVAAIGLAFNTAFVFNMIISGAGFTIEPSLALGAACLISWTAFWGRRGVNVVRRRRRTVQA